MKKNISDELMQTAAFMEWLTVANVTEEQLACMKLPHDSIEVEPKVWIDHNGTAIEEVAELRLYNKDGYYTINVALFATSVQEGKRAFLENTYMNYLVLQEILNRMGSKGLQSYQEWKHECLKQLVEAMKGMVEM